MTNHIRTAVIDDHSMIREGIVNLLEREDEIDIVAQGANGQEAIEIVKEHRPDIVLMDINMPILNGIEATEKIKNEYPKTKIIMLTIHDGEEYIFKAINLGAEGYVLKDAGKEILLSALKNVYNGDAFISPNITKKVFKELTRLERKKPTKENPQQVFRFSKREWEVYKLMAEGNSNKEIGCALNITEKTVKNHVSSIFKKMEVFDRTQAVIKGIKEGVVEV
ncbi:response regulator transcription factor [Proteinivorax hydrogeniformans]|uniref:Stage 0 sporulation protein A homolog n=1 Tax=Proteinivorax hydrogeniformans TaxID=1826727 RepID=A0AAU8HUX2_9FIRM